MGKPKFYEPIDIIADEDQPNTCPFDFARTELLEIRDSYTVERCPCCNKHFTFWNEEI